MDFKKLITAFGFLSFLGLASCGYSGGALTETNDYIIGNPTKSMSGLSSRDEGESSSVVLFDKTVRRIHQFDIVNMKHVRSFAVRNSEEAHSVLHGQGGNYIVDLSSKGLTIFNKYNQANHQALGFQGKPKSAAFLPSKGLLVVYDDLMSVGMLKLDVNGEVLNSWLGGASIVGNKTIASGDINSDGTLILALSDDSIVLVDLEQSMTQKKWVFTQFTTTLSDLRWIAPLPQAPHQILVRSKDKFSLIDINTHALLSSETITGTERLASKFNDPHILVESGGILKVVYAEGGLVKTKTVYRPNSSSKINYVLASNLDLARDEWSFVDSPAYFTTIFGDLDATQEERNFKRYRFSDLLATHTKKVPNKTQMDLASGFIFALFPSELGYAVRYDIQSENSSAVKLFNLKYIPAD